MYLYRTVITEWAHDPGAYNKFIIRGAKVYSCTHVRYLNHDHRGSVMTFQNPEDMPSNGGILKAVMHDERGTWLRYQETTPPRFIEHAHYVSPNTPIKLVPRN
jgi:hypothetical protein